ncbi:MAG: presenilin family intramembrane aspartyl protease [Candidatus Micrarchaeaceae archaeon]
MERVIEYREAVSIISFFMIVQFLGSFLGTGTTNKIVMVKEGGNQIAFDLSIIIYLVIFTLIFLFLMRRFKGKLLFLAIEGFVITFAGFLFFAFLFSKLLPNLNASIYLSVSLFLGILCVVLKNKVPRTRNFVAIISSIGVGIALGTSLSFLTTYLLMLFIAIYDYISVFVTKHMLTLARSAVENNLSFLVGSNTIGVIQKARLTKQDEKSRKEFKEAIKKVGNIRLKSNEVPFVSSIQLGTGDLAIPLMLSVSSFYSFLSYEKLYALVAFSVLGIIFTLFVLRKYKVPLPAIPPLFGFMSIGISIEAHSLIFLIIGLSSLIIFFVSVASIRRKTFSSYS